MSLLRLTTGWDCPSSSQLLVRCSLWQILPKAYANIIIQILIDSIRCQARRVHLGPNAVLLYTFRFCVLIASWFVMVINSPDKVFFCAKFLLVALFIILYLRVAWSLSCVLLDKFIIWVHQAWVRLMSKRAWLWVWVRVWLGLSRYWHAVWVVRRMPNHWFSIWVRWGWFLWKKSWVDAPYVRHVSATSNCIIFVHKTRHGAPMGLPTVMKSWARFPMTHSFLCLHHVRTKCEILFVICVCLGTTCHQYACSRYAGGKFVTPNTTRSHWMLVWCFSML